MKEIKELGMVHESDILIIGGAVSGLSASLTAKESDKDIDILVVDKACSSKGWAGKAARTAGLISFINEDNDPEEFVKYCLNDQHLLRDLAYNSRRVVEHLENWGVSVERDDNGKIAVAQWPFPWVTGGIDPDMCKHMAKKAKEYGVRFEDYIVIVELLKDQDRVVGACGFNIKDGSFHTFLANATILACGSQNFDITPIWCSTGVSQMLVYQAGAKMRNCEFSGMGDFARKDGKGHIFYGMHGGAHTGHDHLYVGDENISQKWRPGFHSSMDPHAANAWYQETKAGKGPIVVDMNKFNESGGGGEFFKFHPEAFRRYMRHHEVAGYPFDDPVFEVVPGVISEMSCIRVGHEMQTSIPCLFAVGDASGSGSARAGALPEPPAKIHGMGLLNALFMGTKGGEAAVLCARLMGNMNLKKCADYKDVERIKNETFQPMDKKNGISPRDIIHKIQETMAPCDYVFVKSEERMKEALAMVHDIKALLPDMQVENFHDLSKGVDAKAMVLCAELFFRASMERKESRGFHLREDFKDMDNENWLRWIIIQKVDGKMSISAEDIPMEQYDYKIL